MARVEVTELTKRFSGALVLDGISFAVQPGEAVAIIGRSGCGKTVLLKHVIGLLRPDSGSVRIDGREIAGLDERELLEVRRRFGMVFQGAALFDSLTVAENVAFALRRDGRLSESAIKRRVAEALALVDLTGIEAKWPSALSGGMRKRVGIARAIVYRPEIVLYDEPTAGLDPVVADSIDRLLARVNRELKVTSIVVTHDMRTARRVAQRALMLHQGRVYASGTLEDLLASTDPLVHRFVNGISDPREIEL